MNRFVFLAWQYVKYHRVKSLILIACITLTVSLPLCINVLLSRFNDQIVARSESTPLVIGAKGSRFDLALHALYFRGQVPEMTDMEEVNTVRNENDGVKSIPIFIPATGKGYPVVGTEMEYFDWRKLSIQHGQSLTRIGQCIIGSAVADSLDLQQGDSIISDSENLLGVSIDYPLKMDIVGVLAPSHSPDDRAIFVDMKTAWVIHGIGHGHEDLTKTDKSKLLGNDGNTIVANSAVLPYNEITDANIGSFHFHGEPKDFPVSAIIIHPEDHKASTLIQGKFVDGTKTTQIIRPKEVIEQLMAMIFKIKRLFDANALLIAISTILLLVLVVLLSLKLRQREMETMFKIGCSRSTVWILQISELAIVGLISALLVSTLVVCVILFGERLIQSIFF